LPLLLFSCFSLLFFPPASFLTPHFPTPKLKKKERKKRKEKTAFMAKLLHLQNLGINVKLSLLLIRDKYKDERQRENETRESVS
jgi:hypothetical protein